MRSFIFSILSTLLLNYISATCNASSINGTSTAERRAADTCADPSLAQVWVDAFSPSRRSHTVRAKTVFVIIDTDGDDWQIQSYAFLAWENIQDFTTPIYQLTNPTTDDFMFLISTDGTPPTASGFTNEGIAGYVYATQVCGSVPLLVAAQTTVGDHFYTTSTVEHTALLAAGWVDGGTAAFVLPLADCSCSS